MSRQNNKAIAIILLVVVGGIFFSLLQSASSVTLDSAFVSKTTKFGNEFIETYDIPIVLSEDQEKALETIIPIFFQDELPAEFQQEAERQREIIGERQLLEEQISNPNNTDSGINEVVNASNPDEQPKGVTNLSASKLVIDRTKGDISSGGLSYLEVTDNTFVRGESVRLAGKMNLNKPAPFFYNVIITCCQMNSFKAMTAVATDAQGNFVLKISTDGTYPIGEWTVDITTIGDSSKILKHTYYFTLLDDVRK